MTQQAVVLPSREPGAELRPRYDLLADVLTADTLDSLRRALYPAEHAVRSHRALIAHDPFHYESYHALFDIYTKAQQVDEAYCIAAALSFLKRATPEEQETVERYRPGEIPMARQRLFEDTLRRHVFHPDQELYLTCILGLIAPAVAGWRAVELPDNLDPMECIDVSADPSLLSRMANYVKDVLYVTQPDVYLRLYDPGRLVMMNVKRDDQLRPSIVVFQDLLRGKTEADLAFVLGRALMDLYVPHFCFVALDRSPAALEQVLMACFYGLGVPVIGDVAVMKQISREIFGRMQPAALEQLGRLVHRMLDLVGSADVMRWVEVSELTANRVGLLLSGDLRVAAQMLTEEQPSPDGSMSRSMRDTIMDLVLYSISEDYFAARRAIGVNVGSLADGA